MNIWSKMVLKSKSRQIYLKLCTLINLSTLSSTNLAFMF